MSFAKNHLNLYQPPIHITLDMIVGYQKITADKTSDANLPDAEIAFQPQTRTSRPLSDAEVARRRPRILMSDAQVAIRGPQPTPRFNSNASLSSSAFQHRREPVSSASQHQSEVRVQRETRVSSVTVSHDWVSHSHVLPT